MVDSHTLLRERIAELLRESGHGWRVVTAPDTATMRRLVAADVFDLVVLDTNLPGVDVVAMARELRRADALTAIVLLTTADVGAGRTRFAPIAGAQVVGKHELATALVPAALQALAWRAQDGAG